MLPHFYADEKCKVDTSWTIVKLLISLSFLEVKNLNARVHVPYVKKNALEKQHSAEALLQTFHEIKALFIPYSVSY